MAAAEKGHYVLFEGELCVVTRVETEPTLWLEPVDDKFDLGPWTVVESDERLAPVPTIKGEG